MNKLIMLIGLPASGKTSFTKTLQCSYKNDDI